MVLAISPIGSIGFRSFTGDIEIILDLAPAAGAGALVRFESEKVQMKSSVAVLLAMGAAALVPAVAAPHSESFASRALPQDPQWSLDAGPGSVMALAGLDESRFSIASAEWSGVLAREAHGEEHGWSDRSGSHDWNEGWNAGRSWDRIPDDDDLGHLINDDDGHEGDHDHGDGFPVGAVPEPATWLLIAIGAVAFRLASIWRSGRIRFA